MSLLTAETGFVVSSASRLRLRPVGTPAHARVSARVTGVARTTRRAVTRAERDGGSDFTSGFVLGGVVFGALGFLFAPQISKALLNENDRLNLPKFMDDDSEPPNLEVTRASLNEKIAQLNSALDDVSQQLKLEKTASAKKEEAAESTAPSRA